METSTYEIVLSTFNTIGTLIFGTATAVLTYRLWQTEHNRDKVKMKVTAVPFFPLDGKDEIIVTVTNLSSFPISIRQCAIAADDFGIAAGDMIDKLPCRLDARSLLILRCPIAKLGKDREKSPLWASVETECGATAQSEPRVIADTRQQLDDGAKQRGQLPK